MCFAGEKENRTEVTHQKQFVKIWQKHTMYQMFAATIGIMVKADGHATRQMTIWVLITLEYTRMLYQTNHGRFISTSFWSDNA